MSALAEDPVPRRIWFAAVKVASTSPALSVTAPVRVLKEVTAPLDAAVTWTQVPGVPPAVQTRKVEAAMSKTMSLARKVPLPGAPDAVKPTNRPPVVAPLRPERSREGVVAMPVKVGDAFGASRASAVSARVVSTPTAASV